MEREKRILVVCGLQKKDLPKKGQWILGSVPNCIERFEETEDFVVSLKDYREPSFTTNLKYRLSGEDPFSSSLISLDFYPKFEDSDELNSFIAKNKECDIFVCGVHGINMNEAIEVIKSNGLAYKIIKNATCEKDGTSIKNFTDSKFYSQNEFVNLEDIWG